MFDILVSVIKQQNRKVVMKNLLLLVVVAVSLSACAPKSGPLNGTYVVGTFGHDDRIVQAPLPLYFSNSNIAEGSCTVGFVVANGRMTFSAPNVTDSASCPVLSSLVQDDVVAYALSGNHLLINGVNRFGDYTNVIAGRQ